MRWKGKGIGFPKKFTLGYRSRKQALQGSPKFKNAEKRSKNAVFEFGTSLKNSKKNFLN